MGNTVKPSTALLPMDDIANVLKEQYQFSSKDDIAKDTDKVAGTDSELMAIAATDELGKLIINRETVKNSLNLGGVSAADYMTRVDGVKIEDFGTNVSKLYANEITELRDELYQLRGELSRQGIINEYGVYSGFQEFFRTGDKKYYYQSLGGIEQNSTSSINISTIYPTQWQSFKVGDWFIIHKIAQDIDFIVKTTAVTTGEVTFETISGGVGIPSTGLEVGNVELFKVLGEYNKGSFSFSKVVANALTSKEKYTMLNDDSLPQMQSIQATNAGYAVGFNVPLAIGGALKKLSVMARSSGSPGALTCYVMEDTEENKSIIKDLDTENIGSDQRIKAKSAPVPASKAALPSPTEIEFDFQNTMDGSYPIIDGSKRYIFIIVAEQANMGGDKWEIQFSKNIYDNVNVDLQSNNKTYTYVAGTGLTEVTNIGDMVFTLATIEVLHNDETPYTEGLYTSESIELHNSTQVARARLSMRINREGSFVAEDSGICMDGGTFSIMFDPAASNGSLPSDLGIRGGDTIAIGTEIRKVTTDCKSLQLTIDKGAYIAKNAQVYKLGYQVFIRAYKKVWDPTSANFVISNEQLVEMPLTCIMPDRTKIANNHSDRLIYECEFRNAVTGLPLDVNTFELQVLWNSHNGKDVLVSNHDLIGRIYDLTLSFDRTL
jgi:hypothetical protein